MTALPALGREFAGRYRVGERLGRGGHGAVFRASDRFLDTDVALKILLPEQLDGVGRDRFRREAELGERLTCPHSVRLHAHGEDEHGVPYIAFELLEGRSLSHWLAERGPQSAESTSRITRAALEALAEAHGLGMVHRDIKPGNIHLCTYRGETDFVKVLDFGIAKRSARDATQLTAADVVVGTARYMAPEQLRGDEISPATDLYSLGLVMAELLAGEPVFRGATIDVCIEQVSPRAVPLPEAVLSSPLAAVIARATDKEAARRFQSAGEMLAALPGAGHRITLVDDEPTQVVDESQLEPPLGGAGATLLYGPEAVAVGPSVVPLSSVTKTVIFGEVPGSSAPVPTSTPPLAPVLAAVPPSNPPYSHVPASTAPGSAVRLSVPPSHPVYASQTSVASSPSSASWAVGIVAAVLLLGALIVAGAYLAMSAPPTEAPPPMPSAR
ncbi:MAG: protein kinase [Myxococcales bacterium]|nr:protein kinase [Myxococcales bacterium]